MAKFKVGDRVRCLTGEICKGLEATIYSEFDGLRTDFESGHFYLIDVDGIGKINPNNNLPIAALDYEIAPLSPPHAEAWSRFKSLHLQPDPAILRATEKADARS